MTGGDGLHTCHCRGSSWVRVDEWLAGLFSLSKLFCILYREVGLRVVSGCYGNLDLSLTLRERISARDEGKDFQECNC